MVTERVYPPSSLFSALDCKGPALHIEINLVGVSLGLRQGEQSQGVPHSVTI
jgi:hypothetical protein